MARYGDNGPYSLDNIECITSTKNNKDRYKNLKRKREMLHASPLV
jgi:hypothetical protein